MKSLTATLLVLACLCTGPAPAAGVPLAIEDAWVREAPPGAAVLAGYLALENRGSGTVIVDAVHSRDFERIELHRTLVEQGVARMLPVERLEVDPGERVSLEPGGMHLMLFKPARPLHQGDRVSFRLELADGTCQRFEAEVRRGSGGDAHQHHHH